jgi:hypothetical protein
MQARIFSTDDEERLPATCNRLPGTTPLGSREVKHAGKDLLQGPPPWRL